MTEPTHNRCRLRVNQHGWFRHQGGPMPELLTGVPIDVLTRSGNATFICGHPAQEYRGWEHVGMSGDIMFWRPTRVRATKPANRDDRGDYG